MKVLIVDDEKYIRSYTKELVLESIPEAAVYESRTAKDAKLILENIDIDILLLDIDIPDANGFELIASLNNHDFELIFVTAHSNYLLDAMRAGASDYILKPIKKEEFHETLDRAIARRNAKLARQSRETTIVQDEEACLRKKLILNHQQGIKFISLKDIMYLKADNVYTTIFLTDNTKITSSKPISRFEANLDSKWFFRIHKSYIINLYHFKEYISKDGDFALMANGQLLVISRYRLSEFLNFVKKTLGELVI